MLKGDLTGLPPTPRTDSTAKRFAPLWAAILAMAPFSSVLVGRSEFYFDDHFRFSTPIAQMFAESVRAGHLPLWNPWILTGTPLIAERGSMVAHPGMLLALGLSPSHAIGTLLVLLLGGLAAGSTALLQALSVRTVLAIGGGAAIGLSGPALTYTSNAPFLATLAFWPLILLSALRLAEKRPAVLGGGLALGMALLGGDLPGALLAALVGFAVFVVAGGRLRTAWLRLIAVLAIALVVGVGSWLPVVWALPFSERGAGIAAAEAGRWSFHPAEILGFLWPHPLGLPLPRLTLWPLRWIRGERLFLHSIWMGAMVSAASVLGLRRREEPLARAFIIIALILIVMATGAFTPLWLVLRPVFTYVRYPSKLVAPAALLIGLAGTIRLDRLLAQPRKIRNFCLVVAGLAATGALVGSRIQEALARAADAPPDVLAAAANAFRGDTFRVGVLAATAAALFYFVERGRLPLSRAGSLLAALVFLDVFATTADLSWTRQVVNPERPSYLPDVQPRGPRVMRLEEVSHARLALSEKAYTEEQLRQAALLQPMTNVAHHASVLDPYGLYLADVAQAMSELVTSQPLLMAEVTASDLVLAAPGSRAPWLADAVDRRRLIPTHSSRAGAVALRVEHALPRSFLATSATLLPRAEIPHRLGDGSGQVLLTAERSLVSGHFAPLDGSAILAPLMVSPPSGPLAVVPTAWRPGAATYKLATSTPALLVEMDAFLPGWRVFVDGHEQSILQANVFGRAVVLPAGGHTVEWRFEPLLLEVALVASWVAVVLAVIAYLAYLLFLGLRLRKPLVR